MEALDIPRLRGVTHAYAFWLALAAAGGLLAFLPQLFVWKAVFGRWVVARPHGAGYVGLASPHLVDVLVSANHGLLSWTPAESP